MAPPGSRGEQDHALSDEIRSRDPRAEDAEDMHMTNVTDQTGSNFTLVSCYLRGGTPLRAMRTAIARGGGLLFTVVSVLIE